MFDISFSFKLNNFLIYIESSKPRFILQFNSANRFNLEKGRVTFFRLFLPLPFKLQPINIMKLWY